MIPVPKPRRPETYAEHRRRKIRERAKQIRIELRLTIPAVLR